MIAELSSAVISRLRRLRDRARTPPSPTFETQGLLRPAKAARLTRLRLAVISLVLIVVAMLAAIGQSNLVQARLAERGVSQLHYLISSLTPQTDKTPSQLGQPQGSQESRRSLSPLSPLGYAATLTGPILPPSMPFGLNFVSGDPGNTGLIGRAGGNTWYFSNVNLPAACGNTTYWGPQNNLVRLSFINSSFLNTPGEILSFQPGQSNLPGGIAVWTGFTINPTGGQTVFSFFNIGTVAAPEIAVEQPVGTDIADGGTKSFGTVGTGQTRDLVFTIKNVGEADLSVGTITKDGTNSGDFTVNTTGMSSTLAPGGSTTFTVTFTPGAIGTRNAAIHITNGDGNENPFDIALTGTGVIPDYTVTTTDSAIVVTDVSGNSDTLAISEPSSGNIKFAAASRVFQIDGSTIITGDSGVISRTSVTSITVNGQGGNDTINVGAFTGTLPSLTINGGIGNDTVNFIGDITFAPNANLDVDLQNDATAGDIDAVTTATNANILTSGTGTITVKVSKNVAMASGSSFVTENGNLIVEANQQATPTAGNFVGINVNNGLIQATGTGTVTVQGKGGGDSFENGQIGVRVQGGGDIIGGTSGLLTVLGTGGGASIGNLNHGVNVTGTGSTITSSGGSVSVTGTGGDSGSGSANHGVVVESAGQITAGGSGTVTVMGQGGNITGDGGTDNYGVFVTGTSSTISSSGGNVSVTGTGGGAGDSSYNMGVFVQSAGQITAGVSGTVTVVGNGGNLTGTGGNGNNYGVYVADTSATITSSGGNVSVTGTGGGAASSKGVFVQSAEITAGGSGTVTVVGNGGNLTGNEGHNVGVIVTGTSSTITSGGGNVSVTGTGGGADSSVTNYGVFVESAGQITAGGSGTVTVVGQGGNGTGGGHIGVYVVDASATITSSGGSVSVTGTGGGSGSGTSNFGVALQSAGQITAGLSGTVTVVGQGGNLTGTGGSNFGVYVDNTSATTSSGGNVSVTGTGGGAGSGTSNFGVALQSAGQITAGGSGTVTVVGNGGNLTGTGGFNRGVWVNGTSSTITSNGGNVSVTGTGGGAGSGDGNMGVRIEASGRITAGGTGTVTVVGQGGNLTGTGGNNWAVFLSGTNSKITSSGGNVSVTGTGGGAGSGTSNYGVVLQSAGQITAGGSGTVTVVGNGGNLTGTGGFNRGVWVNGTSSTITSNGGNVSVTGTGGGAGSGTDNMGVRIEASGLVTAGSGGSVTVLGQGGNLTGTGGNNWAVYLSGTNSTITSSGGNVSVTGTGGGAASGTSNLGVIVTGTGLISAGGSGTVTVVGQGGNLTGTGGSNEGVQVSAATISSSGGNVSVTGTGGGAGSSEFNFGIRVDSGQITAGGSGSVTVLGEGGNLTGTGGENHGVYITGTSSTITSNGGSVSVTGTGGGADSSATNYGVFVESAGQITAGVGGTVTVVGNGGNLTGTGGSSNNGVLVSGTSSMITSGSSGGNVSVTGTEGGGSASVAINVTSEATITTATNGGTVTLIGNSMSFGNDVTISALSASSVTLRQRTPVAIDLGATTDSNGGPLSLSDLEFDVVQAGTINLGSASGGAITVSASITRPSPAVLNLISGANIDISGGSVNSAGSNVNLQPGTYVFPSKSLVDVTTSATTTLALTSAKDLKIVINNTTVDSGYTQLSVAGLVNLNGANLSFTGSTHVPVAGQTFTIVNNDGADLITGTFAGLIEGALIPNFLGSTLSAKISYVGGTNDVVLTVLATVASPVTVSLPHVTGPITSNITVPITVSDLTGKGVKSYDFQITFNPAVAQPQAIPFDTAGTVSSTMLITPNATNLGHLIISASQATDLTGSGTLINLKFTVVGAPGQSTPTTFQDYVDPGTIFHPGFRFNVGVPAAGTSNGSITVNGPTASNGTVSGQIVDDSGNRVEGAAIRMGGTQNRLTITDAQGNYHFDNVETGGFYTVTPSRANYVFAPAQRSFSQIGQNTEAVFSASSTSEGLNPLDTTEYFVRQQYVDFLSREPDEAGFNFWVNNIAACGTDSDCLAAKRTDTSAAFFISIEFQQTGYLVHRMYQSAYGDMAEAPVPLTRGQFRPDKQAIGQGVVVNQSGWEAKLESNTQAFASAFVGRTRFTLAYPVRMTPTEFVDRLFRNGGVTPEAGDRAAAISEFGGAADTADAAARARAVRRVAENATLRTQKFNQAFVLMQYFGYLGRDPNAAPDTDFSGYNFWLNKLDSFNGDFRAAEMVKAFLVAGEYRGRFPR